MRILRSLPAIIAAIIITAAPLPSPAQFSVGVGFTVGVPPPALPVYTQPACPYANWIWTPGYWGWGQAGYYWVPGVWVAPPQVGVYWTPGYWGYSGGGYGWNGGYWGPSVGFYGGLNYGFGYYGSGFVGGVWAGNAFRYNTAVVNVNRTVIHNTYINKTVVNNYHYNNGSRVAYTGGRGGVSATATSAQVQARRTGRAPTTEQVTQAKVAGQDRSLYANVNKGKPPVTAVAKPISDPKQLPKYAPVTAADKQAAQTQMKGTNKAPTTTMAKPEHKAPAMAPAKAPAKAPVTTQHHAAPVSQPANKKPPSGGNTMHTQGGTQPQGAMHPQGKPPGGAMHQGQAHPQGQGKPPSGQGKPPGNGGQSKPPGNGGQNKGKPPQG